MDGLTTDWSRFNCIYIDAEDSPAMPQSSRKRLLWRDLTVFDGQQVLAEPMAVLVEGDQIAGLWHERDFAPMLAAGAEEAGRGGVLTSGLVDCLTPLVYAGNRAGEFE